MTKQANNKPTDKPAINPFGILAIGIALGVLVVGTPVLLWHHNPDAQASLSSLPTFRSAPATTRAMPGMADMTAKAPLSLDPAVARVASRFTCGCGQCQDRLDVCTCDTAQGERGFIQNQLRAGHTEAEIINAMKQKYGGLKSQLSGNGAG